MSQVLYLPHIPFQEKPIPKPKVRHNVGNIIQVSLVGMQDSDSSLDDEDHCRYNDSNTRLN